MKPEYVWTHPARPGRWRWIDCTNDVVQFASLDGHEDVYTNRRQSGFTLWTPGEVFTEWVDFDYAEPFANPLPDSDQYVWVAVPLGALMASGYRWYFAGQDAPEEPQWSWNNLDRRPVPDVYAWCPLVVPEPPPRKEI